MTSEAWADTWLGQVVDAKAGSLPVPRSQVCGSLSRLECWHDHAALGCSSFLIMRAALLHSLALLRFCVLWPGSGASPVTYSSMLHACAI